MGFVADPEYPGAVRFKKVKVEQTPGLLKLFAALPEDTPFECLNRARLRIESGGLPMVQLSRWHGDGVLFENLLPLCADEDPEGLGYRIKVEVIRETKAYFLEVERARPSRLRSIEL